MPYANDCLKFHLICNQIQVFDGRDFTPKNSPITCAPFDHKKEPNDGQATALDLKSFEDVEKLPPSSVVPSIKAKVVNLSPRKPVRSGASHFRTAGLLDVKGQRNAVNLFGDVSEKVEAGKVHRHTG